ncbi:MULTISPECIES: CopG family transcriptional regulator [Staphylococcaceae]|nr:CopG family transcriptional regulator [Macrococcus caseolyticus]
MMTDKRRFTITMSDTVHGYLEKVCKEKGLTKSAMLTVALEEYRRQAEREEREKKA